MPSDITGHRHHPGGPGDRAPPIWCSCPARSSPTSSWPTRSTARRPRRRPRCSRRCRSTASPCRARRTRSSRAVLRLRHAEPDRAGGHLSAARSAARPLHVRDRDRLPARGRGGRGRALDDVDARIRGFAARASRGADIVAFQRLVRRVPVADAVARYAVQLRAHAAGRRPERARLRQEVGGLRRQRARRAVSRPRRQGARADARPLPRELRGHPRARATPCCAIASCPTSTRSRSASRPTTWSRSCSPPCPCRGPDVARNR